MACPAYGSTSGMALYYVVDPDPALALPATLTWGQVPMTSESLVASLTSSISERITSARAYAGSTPTKGEVSGNFAFEAEASPFMNDMLMAALQAAGPWAAGAAITNGKTVACYAFLKSVDRPGGTDYYVFRGCQVDTMTMKVSPGAFITGEVSIMGVRPGAGILGATDGSNDILSVKPAGWTLTPAVAGNLMSSGFALQNFEVQSSLAADLGVIAQELNISIGNQLRVQDAVGTGTPYAAGVASGRFKATVTANAYYSGPGIINRMLSDESLKIVFDLLDASDDGWNFNFDSVKATTAPPPQAGGPDQDVMSNTEFQAFQSATLGTVTITRTA
jgi:hypothetical protein